MTHKPVDWTRPLRTAGGLPARVITKDKLYNGVNVVVTLIQTSPDNEIAVSHSQEGKYLATPTIPHTYDLVNAPVVQSQYYFLYLIDMERVFCPTLDKCKSYALERGGVHAIVEVVYENKTPVRTLLHPL